MSERLYIVIVDDDKLWRESIKKEFLGKRAPSVVTYSSNNEAVIAIAKSPPVHLLIDFSLCENRENGGFLSRLKDQGMSISNEKNDCNIWIVSDYPSLDISPLKQYFPSVHRFWFAKPLKSVDGILAKFEIVKQVRNLSDTIKIPINSIPWPVRIFDEYGQPVAVNNHWINASNRPVHPELNQLKQSTQSSIHWGALPGRVQDQSPSTSISKPEYGFFNLCTFKFNSPSQPNFYGQLCDEVDSRPQTLSQLVERCFEALRQTGFTKVEFYLLSKIPGSHGGIQRMDEQGNLGYIRLIETNFYKCIQKKMLHRIKKIPTGELLYEWVKNNDLALASSEMKAPYAKAPVIFRSPWTGKKEVVALILWKKDDATLESTEESIKPIIPLLLALFNQITNTIRKQQQQDRLKRWKQIDEYETKIVLYKEQNIMEKEMLQAAITITNASAGYFVGNTLDNISLPIRSVRGYKELIPENIPLNEKHFPEIRCRKYKRPYFIPNYQRLHSGQKLTLNDCQMILNDEEKAKALFKLIDGDRGSVCALPIHAGELMLGVLVLESEYPFHFNQTRVKTIEQLLERTRWHLNAVVEAKRRNQWEHAVMHELRKGLDIIGKAVDELIDPSNSQEKKPETDLKRAKRNQISLMDLTDDFLDSLGRNLEPDQNIHFENPMRAISEFYLLYQEQIEEWDQQSFSFHPKNRQNYIWRLSLMGDYSVFARVVRNLLHNAIKFSEKETDILISASRDGYYWKLIVSNPGQLQEEELRQCFIPFAKPIFSKQDGSHIGLSANRELVEQIGGTLTLNNKPENLITAELNWPLYTGD